MLRSVPCPSPCKPITASLSPTPLFSGNFIGETGSKERALAWVPDLMKFAAGAETSSVADDGQPDDAVDEVTEQAA